MAEHDWNQNGRKDTADNFMEYNIYQKSCNTGSYSGGFGWKTVLITIVILLVIGWIMELAEPEDTYRHEAYSHHSYSTTDHNYNSTTDHNYNSTTDRNYNSATVKEADHDHASRSTVSKSVAVPDHSTCDTYNVKDYSDAEDFYDDNQDDFEDEEDAEDYYNDAMNE